jgi:adenylate cyclase
VHIIRRLAAIMVADVAGYSRLMHEQEEATHAAYTAAMNKAIEPAIAAHGGRIVKSTGDGFLAEFASAVEAVGCGLDFQAAIQEQGMERPGELRLAFRVGIHIGDVIIETGDIFGDGVNIAARIEGLADPGGLLVSDAVQENVRGRLPCAFEDLGTRQVKNIGRPIHVFRVLPEGQSSGAAPILQLRDQPSIVVLPFQNLSADPDQDYFADGVVEEITTALSRFPSLFVIARNTAFTYKGRAVDLRAVGRDLAVRYVLDGSIRKAANQVRIIAQLIQTESGVHIWADRYDRELDDIFALQDELAANVVSALVPTLEHSELARSRRKPPESLDSYDLYLRALAAFQKGTRDGNEEAQDTLAQALELDPNFVPALLLADACCFTGHFHGWMPQRETLDQAMSKVRLALQIEPGNSEALAALSRHLVGNPSEREEVVSLAERAAAANPNSWLAMRTSGFALINAGRPERALFHFARALRLSPRDPLSYQNWNGMAFALVELGRYEEAVAAGREAVHSAPGSTTALRALAAALALIGQIDEAKATVRGILKLDPNCSLATLVRNGASESVRPAFFRALRLAGIPEEPGAVSRTGAA